MSSSTKSSGPSPTSNTVRVIVQRRITAGDPSNEATAKPGGEYNPPRVATFEVMRVFQNVGAEANVVRLFLAGDAACFCGQTRCAGSGPSSETRIFDI
jgi:hypothetical protein